MLPAIVFVLIVYVFPIYKVFQDSFFSIDGLQKTFVGLKNFRFLLVKDSLFLTSITNNFKLLLGIPILVGIALFLAYLLYSRVKGWQVFRVIFIIPYILSITAIGIAFDFILRENGLFNQILNSAGLDFLAKNWLGDADIAIYSILGVVIWKELGFGIVLFLSRMLSIDKQIVEAAVIDGASSWQTFLFVILPQMTNVILFYVVINMINMLSWMFNYIFVMTRGGPVKSTYVLEYYIYQTGIRYRQYGVSSALAVITFLLAIALVVGQSFVRKKIVQQRGW
jgi:ABC-type sugar transport system permease subunit